MPTTIYDMVNHTNTMSAVLERLINNQNGNFSLINVVALAWVEYNHDEDQVLFDALIKDLRAPQNSVDTTVDRAKFIFSKARVMAEIRRMNDPDIKMVNSTVDDRLDSIDERVTTIMEWISEHSETIEQAGKAVAMVKKLQN